MRSSSRSVLLALAMAAATTSMVAGQSRPFGPLSSEEGSPLHRISFTPMTEGADLTRAGGWTFDAWTGYSNIFEQDSSATHELFLDMERIVTTLGVRWGARDGLEIGARLTLETTWTGMLDEFIVSYHNMFGFGNANRERYPANRYGHRLSDGGDRIYLDAPSRTLAVEDVRAFVKWRIGESDGGRRLTSLRLSTRLPTNDDIEGGERVDVSIMWLTRRSWDVWHLHGLLGASTTRAAPAVEAIMAPGSVFFSIAIERTIADWVSGVAQFQAQSAVMRSFDDRELDQAPTNLVLGFSGRLGSSWSWDASFQEDLPPDTPAVDFTAGLRISRSW